MGYRITLKYKVICAGTSPDTHPSPLTGLIGDMDRSGSSDSTLYFGVRRRRRWSLIMFTLSCVVGNARLNRQSPPMGRSMEEDLGGTKDLVCL